MRIFYMLATICITGVCSLSTHGFSYHPGMIKCANELNIDLSKAIKAAENTGKPNDDMYSLLACERLESSRGKATLYEEIMHYIKLVDVEYGIKNKPYTREELENKLTECKSKGLSELDFLKCIKYLEPPFWDFVRSYG